MKEIRRLVCIDFWTHDKTDDFSPEDKYFMLWLLTNPYTTQLGIYVISPKHAAVHLGYSLEALYALLERFEKVYGMIWFSRETKEIAIKNYLKHSIIKGGKPVEDCIISEMKKVKNKDLIDKVFRHLWEEEKVELTDTVIKIIKDYLHIGDTPHDSSHDTGDNDNEYEDEYDNEDDNDNGNDNETPAGVEKSAHPPYQQVVDMFNDICVSFPNVKALTDKRKKAIKARLNEYSFDDIEQAFVLAEESDFLKGANPRGWKANFDWMMDENNIAKVLEGNYKNRVQQQQTVQQLGKNMHSKYEGIVFDD